MSSNGFSKDPPEGEDPPDGDEEVAITCDALCSLGNSSVHSLGQSPGQSKQQSKKTDGQDCAIKFCVKTQGQLPLFLTSTFVGRNELTALPRYSVAIVRGSPPLALRLAFSSSWSHFRNVPHD
jgi:hypothetical protein